MRQSRGYDLLRKNRIWSLLTPLCAGVISKPDWATGGRFEVCRFTRLQGGSPAAGALSAMAGVTGPEALHARTGSTPSLSSWTVPQCVFSLSPPKASTPPSRATGRRPNQQPKPTQSACCPCSRYPPLRHGSIRSVGPSTCTRILPTFAFSSTTAERVSSPHRPSQPRRILPHEQNRHPQVPPATPPQWQTSTPCPTPCHRHYCRRRRAYFAHLTT